MSSAAERLRLLGKATESCKPPSTNTIETGKDTSTALSMKQLKEKAIRTGVERLKALEESALLKQKQEDLWDIKRLPAFCRTLRSYCIADKRSCMPTASCVRRLADDFRVSKASAQKILDILRTLCPDFLTEFPADDLVTTSTLRINSQVDYPPMYKKVLNFVANYIMENSAS